MKTAVQSSDEVLIEQYSNMIIWQAQQIADHLDKAVKDEDLLRQVLEYLEGTVQVNWSKPLMESIRARLEGGM